MKKNMNIIATCLLTAALTVTCCWAITKNNTESDPTPNQYANTITAPPVPQSMTFAGEEVPLDVYWVHEALDRELIVIVINILRPCASSSSQPVSSRPSRKY